MSGIKAALQEHNTLLDNVPSISVRLWRWVGTDKGLTTQKVILVREEMRRHLNDTLYIDLVKVSQSLLSSTWHEKMHILAFVLRGSLGQWFSSL